MSSLKDLASLIMVPSLYKDGELHTVKPLGNSILHPDATGNHDGTDGSTPAEGNFTFSRGSNLAATRVDVNGLIEKGRENRLLQSNTFSNATWSKTNASVTSGQAGYDGNNDAWLFTSTGNFARIQQSAGPTGVLTLSAYVKAGTTDWVMLRIAGSGYNVTQYFDLTNGVVGSISGVSAKITSVGGGWYRCEATANASASASSYIYSALGDGNLSVTNETIYIQDAQLEAGLVATDYIETGASTAQAGILEDMPRLDYSGGASCPALLLEPQRTNLLAYSEYFSASGVWLPNTITITDNYGTSPEGLSNSTRLVLGNLTASRIAYAPTLANGTTYTFSCYYKGTAGEKLYMEGNGSGGSGTQTSKLITLTGEWQREDLQFVGGSTSNLIYVVDSRNGTEDTAQDFEVFGAQVEAGSYPTSYIPTYGSSVTRSYDSCLATSVSNLIGQEQGTFLVDATLSNVLDSNLRGLIELNDGTTDNRFSIYRGGNTLNITALVFTSGVAQSSAIVSSTGRTKIAIAYDSSSVRFYFNGTLVKTSTSVLIPTCSQVDLGIITNRADRVLGDVINQTAIFPTALTDSECIALTTL